MVNWICGAICGSAITLLLYSILVGKRIQEERDKATKCIFKYKELIAHRSVLWFFQNLTLEELVDIVKEKLDKSYTGREIKKHDK